MQSNPIQQRIELICEKWEEAKKYKDARLVRIQCQADEDDMVDTFYTYMIGADTPILDIAFHFDSPCSDLRLFSTDLLKELEETIDIWNHSQKDERIDYISIDWKPDYSLQKDKNPAAMFVHNFNRLAKEMDLGPGLFAVAIFKGAVTNKNMLSWVECAIEARISTKVKYLIYDTVANPFFQALSASLDSSMATIPLNLNMPKAMEQVAAMGDPKDPATAYRPVFMKMMNAMGEQKEAEAEKFGHECIRIANQNLSRDPYWIMQVVVVYIALGNDKIRYKKRKETLDYANKAVETAVASKVHFEDQAASALMAQSLMFRAAVLFMHGTWMDAFTDFSVAFGIYRKQGNMALAIEACRMAGKSAINAGLKSKGLSLLAEGVRVGKNMDVDTVRSSTFPGILELLLPNNYAAFISPEEVDEIATNFYGPHWVNVVKDWKKAPDIEVLRKQELEAAG